MSSLVPIILTFTPEEKTKAKAFLYLLQLRGKVIEIEEDKDKHIIKIVGKIPKEWKNAEFSEEIE